MARRTFVYYIAKTDASVPRGAEFLNEVCGTFKDLGGILNSEIRRGRDRLTFLIRNDTL